jgi:hypothetical protein
MSDFDAGKEFIDLSGGREGVRGLQVQKEGAGGVQK